MDLIEKAIVPSAENIINQSGVIGSVLVIFIIFSLAIIVGLYRLLNQQRCDIKDDRLVSRNVLKEITVSIEKLAESTQRRSELTEELIHRFSEQSHLIVELTRKMDDYRTMLMMTQRGAD